MWLDQKRSWIVTVLLGGAALPHIWARVLGVTLLSLAVTVLYEKVPAVHVSITATPFTLIGLPLGIFLGFRNTASYDRFWEARKLWGGLVNTTRSFSRQILIWIDAPPEAGDVARGDVSARKDAMVRRVVAYVHALRRMLRDRSPFDRLEGLLTPEELERLRAEENVPLAILHDLGERLRDAYRRGEIHPQHVPMLDASLVALTDLQGACERIKGTPIPYSYTVLMHRIVGVYCLCLPFGLQESVGWATPVVALLVSYAFFGLDAIGDEIEQPFGKDRNDLPLSAISRTIEMNLRRRLGDADVPPPFAPRDGVLS